MRAASRFAVSGLALLLFALLLLACGRQAPAAEDAPPATQPPAVAEAPAEAEPTRSQAAVPSLVPSHEPTIARGPTFQPTKKPATEPIPEMLIALPGLSEIVLLTPAEGVGLKPGFEWQTVNGAVRYALLVYHPNGQPYWAWEGSGTSVYLGGGDSQAPPEDSAGPILLDGMSWGVMAFDAADLLIASSAMRPISP